MKEVIDYEAEATYLGSCLAMRMAELEHWRDNLPEKCGETDDECTCERALYRAAGQRLFDAVAVLETSIMRPL